MREPRIRWSDFVEQKISPGSLKNISQHITDNDFPLARNWDFMDPEPPPMSDWPYCDPDAAYKNLTRRHLESDLWSKICERVTSGEWSCEACAEDEVTPTPLTGFLLRRASSYFSRFYNLSGW